MDSRFICERNDLHTKNSETFIEKYKVKSPLVCSKKLSQNGKAIFFKNLQLLPQSIVKDCP